jgi:hypothetical protein
VKLLEPIGLSQVFGLDGYFTLFGCSIELSWGLENIAKVSFEREMKSYIY